MSFGKKIRQIRLEKGLKQEDITKVLGYNSNSYISDVEIGKFIPQPDKLEKLGIDDPAFTMMFKEVPRMTREEKQSLIRAYEAVIRARNLKR